MPPTASNINLLAVGSMIQSRHLWKEWGKKIGMGLALCCKNACIIAPMMLGRFEVGALLQKRDSTVSVC